MPEGAKPHKRVNDILLGPLERPALQWLAAKAPAWATPDTMTLIGIIRSVMIFASYCLTNLENGRWFLWLASLGFIINWYGDSLDGTLARYRKIERPKYGFFVAHIVDAFSELLILLGLGLTPYIKFEVACLALIGYLLLSVLVYIRTYVDGVFQISYGKIGPTEVRVLLIIINTLLFFFGNPVIELPFGAAGIFDLVVGAVAVILFLIFTGQALQKTRELYKLGG